MIAQSLWAKLRGRSKSALFRDLFLTSSSGVLVLVLGLAAGILSARLLGPEGRGELATALVWVGLLGALGDLGLPQAITYSVAKNSGQAGVYVSTALALAAALGLVLILLGHFILIPVLDRRGAAVDALRCYIFSIPAALGISVVSTAFQGLGNFRVYNLLRISQTGIYALGVASLALLKWDRARHVTLVMLVMQAAALAAGAILLSRQVPWSQWRPAAGAVESLLGYGLKSYFGNLAWLCNGKLDQMLCSVLLSPQAVGFYAVSVSYGALLMGLSGAFASVAFHRVASAPGRAAGLAVLGKLFGWNFAFNAGLCVLLILAAPFLIPLAFGEAFAASVGTAKLLAISGGLLGCNYILSNGLRGLGLPLIPSKAEAAGLAANVVLIWVLAQRFGILGIAAAACLSYSVVLLLLWSAVARERRAIKQMAPALA